MAPMALSMKPTGWFQIGWSADFTANGVRPLRYFGRDLVAYRTTSGRLVVLDAYCEHLGANMAFGGSVHGEDIQCPFHGWRWSPEGRNTCIPYQERTNQARRIGTWRTTERDGVAYLWHDAEGGAPEYEVPSLFDLFTDCGGVDAFHSPFPGGTYTRESLSVHPQYVIENGVDFAHFKYVHRAEQIPQVVRREFGENDFVTELLLRFTSTDTTGERHEVEGRTHGHLIGIGLGFSYATGVGNICSLTAVTPVDDEMSDLRFSAWVSDDGDTPERLAKRQRSAIAQLKADVAIWEHQRYTEPPGLATAEAAGFREIRRWARRFYPEGHKGSAAEDQDAGTDAPPTTDQTS